MSLVVRRQGEFMALGSKAAIRATIATAIVGILMLVPPIGIPIFVIVLMLPLWALDGIGIVDFGHELNGFFVPNAAGWSLAALVTWALLFVLFYGLAKKKASRSQGQGGGTPSV